MKQHSGVKTAGDEAIDVSILEGKSPTEAAATAVRATDEAGGSPAKVKESTRRGATEAIITAGKGQAEVLNAAVNAAWAAEASAGVVGPTQEAGRTNSAMRQLTNYPDINR